MSSLLRLLVTSAGNFVPVTAQRVIGVAHSMGEE
jgi:hypothetical protein